MATQKQPVKTQGIDIEALLAKSNKISSEALKSAIATLQEENNKKNEKLLIENLRNVQGNTADAVTSLRYAREKEKRAKSFLQAMAEAENEFLASADINAYNKAVYAAKLKY